MEWIIYILAAVGLVYFGTYSERSNTATARQHAQTSWHNYLTLKKANGVESLSIDEAYKYILKACNGERAPDADPFS